MTDDKRKEKKEKKRAYDRAYREANYERVRARERAYNEANKEKKQAYDRAYRKANYEKVRAHRNTFFLRPVRYRAKKAGIPFDLTESDVHVPESCPICGVKMERGGELRNSPSVDRIFPARGYVRGNIVVVCCRCNAIKSDATPKEIHRVAVFYHRLIESLGLGEED